MTDSVDCRIFEDQLDVAAVGDIPDDAMALLRAHAAVCAPCRALLSLRAHLPGPSLEELEAQVPDAWVTEMEGAVLRAIAPAAAGTGETAPRSRWSRRVWVPALAAAALASLFFTGLTVRALGHSRARADALASQLLDQQRRLADLGAPFGGASPTGSRFSMRESLLRALGRQDVVTVSDLRELLDRLPDDATVLAPGQTQVIGQSRWVPSPWREAFQTLPQDTGATAGDLRNALDRLDLPGDAAVSAHRLLDLLG
ncbi:MAG: hypothetical protein KJP18_02890 [Gemmatimonadetes bacterium]|nr:hypothetical protein [Gemmatimonadota bacterium]NNF39101.1 hypothetical protein [Gemmatimonadota bacterium]